MKILLGLLLAASGFSAAAEMPAIDEPARWATPVRVVPPVYPEGATTAPVVVEASLKLNDSGRIDAILSISSDPKLRAFEESVMAALPHWRFTQTLNDQCMPTPANSVVKVWFDLKDGRPEVSVSSAPKQPASGPGALKWMNAAEVRDALKRYFPREARRQSEPADVYARLDVDPRTGQTLNVEIMSLGGSNQLLKRADAPGGDTLPHARTLANQYANAAHHALMMSRFEPDAARGDGPVKVCRRVNFRIGEKS